MPALVPVAVEPILGVEDYGSLKAVRVGCDDHEGVLASEVDLEGEFLAAGIDQPEFSHARVEIGRG